MRFSKGFHHEQIIEYYLAISACFCTYLRLPVRRIYIIPSPITIPGSIIGMLIMFVLLALQILPAKWVNPGCYLLIRYMALLFVPIGVGVMQYYDLLRAQFGPIIVSCAVSTVIVFLVVSWSTYLAHGERKIAGQEGNKE